MDKSGILRPGERLNGTELAHVRLRPLRLGFIVPDDDPSIVARVVESCSLTWGGYLNPIIPYSRSHGLTTEWRRILELLDPDDLVDCVGILEADQAEFTQHRQHVHKWEDPANTFFTVGALQYSALKAFGDHLKSTTTQHIVINPILTSTDPLYLPLIARWGRLNESFIEETLRFHNWETSARYHQFVTVEDVDFSESEKDTLLGMTPTSFYPPSGTSALHHIIDLTLLGIDQHYPPHSLGEGSPERPQHNEGWSSCVVITGEPHSVADMSLYWDLRIERPWSGPFPLWIPLEILDTDEGKQIVDTALARIEPRLKEGPAHSSTLYILSSSTTMAELQTRLKTRFPDSVIRTEDLDLFLTGDWEFDLDRGQREVYFNDGHVRVPLSTPPALKNFGARDRIIDDIKIGHVRIPRSKSLNDVRLGGLGLRITRHGTFEQFSNIYYRPAFLNVSVPDGWTILTSMLDDAGYECAPSDKGRLALGQLAQLGEIEDVGIIASSRLYALLRRLSASRGNNEGSERLFVAGRRLAQFSEFIEPLGREVATTLVKWLLSKGILLRGARIECPRCELETWYEVDRIGRTWHCDGCQVSLPIPLDPNVTPWIYRINELYARGHDLGTITHLLALYNLYPPFLLGDVSNLGYYPGVVLKAKEDSGAPVDEVEIDVIGIREGKLILAECKGTGGALTEEDAFKLAKVANHLTASRLIFVTSTDFPDAESLFAKVQERCQARVEFWEGKDIFDQRASERMGGQPDDLTDEVRASQYLERLSRRLVNFVE